MLKVVQRTAISLAKKLVEKMGLPLGWAPPIAMSAAAVAVHLFGPPLLLAIHLGWQW